MAVPMSVVVIVVVRVRVCVSAIDRRGRRGREPAQVAVSARVGVRVNVASVAVGEPCGHRLSFSTSPDHVTT